MTQSVGVPFTAKWRSPTSRSRSGSLSDSECDDAGLVGLRRDHPDVVGQFARDLLADFEAGSVNAVVVGDQNAHLTLCRRRHRDSGDPCSAPYR